MKPKLKTFASPPPLLNRLQDAILERVYDDADQLLGFIMKNEDTGEIYSRKHGEATEKLAKRLEYFRTRFPV